MKENRNKQLDEASMNLTRCNLPYNVYGHPSMKQFLLRLGEYRAKTDSVEYAQLIEKMTKRKDMVSRNEALASKFKKV